MHIELSGWLRSALAVKCKKYQNDYFGPKITMFGHFEGVTPGYLTCHSSISKKHPFAPQYQTSMTRSQEAACIPILLLGRGKTMGRGETMA